MKFSFGSWMNDDVARGVAALLAAALLALYLAALPPTFATPEAAEMSATSFTLGVAPPPGSPAYMLAGKAWATAVPMGSVAFRYNLFSALCLALAAGFLFLLAKNLGAGIPLALAGALAFGLSRAAFVGAGRESFEALLLVLTFLAFQKWNIAPSSGGLAAFGLACGVLVAERPAYIALVAFLFIASSFKFQVSGFRPRVSRAGTPVSGFFFPALAGMLLLAVVPLRAMTSPEIAHGNAASLRGLAAHVSARDAWTGALSREKDERATLGGYARALSNEMTIPGVVLGVVGLAGLAWASPALAGAAVLLVAGDALGETFLSAATEGASPGVPALLALGLTVAGAGVLLSRIVFPFMAYARPWAFLALALPAAFLAARAPEFFSRTENFILYDNALETLHAVDGGGVLLAHDKGRLLPLAYLRAVERRRPDIKLTDREGNLSGNVFESLYSSTHGTTPLSSFPAARRPEIRKEAEEGLFFWALDSGTPLYATAARGDYFPSPRYDFAAAGPLYRLVSSDSPHEGLWRTFYRFVLRGEEEVAKTPRSVEIRRALAMRDIGWGEFFWSAGRWEEGTDLLRRAARSGADDPSVHFAVGMSFLRKARPAEAIEAFEDAVRLAPRFTEAWAHLGTARERRNMFPEAIAAFERARDLTPDRAESHAALGEALRRAKRYTEALAAYRRALELAPRRADFRIHFADLLAGEGHLGEAARALEQGTLLPDAPMDIWERLALVHEATGNLPRAIEIWREVERRGEMSWTEHAQFEQARLRDLMTRGAPR